ncbi:MAG TPA: OPT family oligopeptide transporter [Opitutaceae bacterium]|nr:OPT family oligopeptide transporter [Opitutaceae bacterium]
MSSPPAFATPDAPSSHPTAPADSVEPLAIACDPARSEADWHRYVYQGDTARQLTLRAVLIGAFLGMLMSAANLYTTLKIGWSFGVAITACVLSYVIWNTLRFLSGRRLSEMSVLENNCMQSTASAAGYSTGSTIGTAFGALLLLEGHHQPVWVVATFTLFSGALGVFLAVPMKRQMINREKLPFPSGMAAAITLKSLYSRGAEAVRKAYVLIGGLVAGLVVGILNTAEGTLGALDRFFLKTGLHLPELIPATGYAAVNGRQLMGFGFEPSVLLIGAGMIIGVRVCLSMLAGSLLLYCWIGPALIAMDASHAGESAYRLSIPLIGGGAIYHLPRWALWGGTATMVFSSLAALALQWRTIARSFRVPSRSQQEDAESQLSRRMAALEVPLSWLVAGLVPITVGLLAVQFVAFRISLWLGLIAVGMSFVLSLVASRATGETDTNPIGAMGKIMQLLFAVLSPPAASSMHVALEHNLMAASTGANAASSSADLLLDLKSGYLLGANPRKQFLAQFIGIFFGTLAVVPAWYLMVPTKEKLEAFNPPATNMWRAVAELLAGGGLDQLPASARLAIVIGALVGVTLPLLGRLLPRAGPYLPSAMGLGLSWVMVYSNCQAFAAGAVISWVWTKVHPRSADAYNTPLAAGFIAGESLIKALIAMTATAIGLWAARS